MPILIGGPAASTIINVRPLNQHDFESFGTVIENPQPSLIPSAHLKQLPANAVQANQGSALKYLDVTHMQDFYKDAPSKKVGKAVMNMFVCAPRELEHSGAESSAGLFPVEILERHPFTTQTFVPLGASRAEQDKSRYLVIVAPSLPPSWQDLTLPVPVSLSAGANGVLPGRGLPDLSRIRAFIATGAQAVTYGAGTWHAPMVAIGKEPLAFVVIQFANGVGIEDCQEAVFRPIDGKQIRVEVPKMPGYGSLKL